MSNKYLNLLKPTALIQYEATPSMKFKYKSYDEYVENNYLFNKNKWMGRVGVISEQPRSSEDITTDSSIIDNSLSVEVAMDKNEVEEINELIFKGSVPDSNPTYTENVEYEHEVKLLKTKKKKVNNNAGRSNTNCPYCLSKLKVNELNIIECTGDKLQIWEEQFQDYRKADEKEKSRILKRYSDTSTFIDLYESWVRCEFKLECTFTNRLFNPITKFSTMMYDPIVLYLIEKSLGRKLLEEEKAGEVEIYKEGRRFFTDYKEGRTKVKVPQLQYPQSFL